MKHNYHFTALPVLFKIALHNLETEAEENAVFRCELTKPRAKVTWRKNNNVIESSSKYELKQDGVVAVLIIYKLQRGDSGDYSCETEHDRTSAKLTVNGRNHLIIILIPPNLPNHPLWIIIHQYHTTLSTTSSILILQHRILVKLA